MSMAIGEGAATEGAVNRSRPVTGMPPNKWAASERSLYVRTVWVSGLRHAVLYGEKEDHRRPSRRRRREVGSAPPALCRGQRETADVLGLSGASISGPTLSERVLQWLKTSREKPRQRSPSPSSEDMTGGRPSLVLVQNFPRSPDDSPKRIRPLTTYSANRSRPQLHIFMPHVPPVTQ